MATVYEGHDPSLGRKVALKVIKDRYASNVDFVVRFLEEARAVARVNDPNVVTVYFAGSDRGKHFFAMELLPGPDLEYHVERQGPLPPAEALSYLRQSVLGLSAAAAQGLVHCDVKPSNLVFGADGLLKVTDFGIAQHLDTKDDAATSGILGTPCYMSPEQVMEEPVDHRTDIYSLGATLHFLLSGEPPYDGDDAAEVALRQVNDPVPQLPKAPRKVRRLLSKMMAKSPDERHADYNELLADVDRLL
jgi:serine/threonine-protein kinase